MSRKEKVKEFFEHPEKYKYLTWDYNLRIRAENVKAFISDNHFSSILDMPCGNGYISIPLLKQCDQLTMIDISSNMIRLARSRIPPQYRKKVTLINKDFYEVDLPDESFDLILAIGILAHIDSPEKFIKKIMSLVKPGGSIIIQNTDSSHWHGFLIHFLLRIKELGQWNKYRLNKVKSRTVEQLFLGNGFELINKFRYNQPFLGLARMYNNERKYRLKRKFFGYVNKNKHSSWGSDYTWHFRKKAVSYQ